MQLHSKRKRKLMKIPIKLPSTHVDSLFKLMKGNSAVVAEHLSTNILTNGSCSIKLQEHVCLQQILCTLDFIFGNHGAEFHPFTLNVEEHVFALHWVTNKVNSPQSSVLIACVE